MAQLSPYRSLPAAQRQQLVIHDISTSREARNSFVQAIVARGGGFRPSKLREWPPAQLAREVVRHNLENAEDELRLLVGLYVEVQPEIQTLFLETAGVPHEGATMPEDAAPPFAPEAAVLKGADAVMAGFGDDGRRYLRTIWIYNGDGWPGLGDYLQKLDPPA
ncbi:MAG TPA: hypothetical protein VGM77_05470 [Gemmatimonadales bacterium]|jgi:hypothetical protein